MKTTGAKDTLSGWMTHESPNKFSNEYPRTEGKEEDQRRHGWEKFKRTCRNVTYNQEILKTEESGSEEQEGAERYKPGYTIYNNKSPKTVVLKILSRFCITWSI